VTACGGVQAGAQGDGQRSPCGTARAGSGTPGHPARSGATHRVEHAVLRSARERDAGAPRERHRPPTHRASGLRGIRSAASGSANETHRRQGGEHQHADREAPKPTQPTYPLYRAAGQAWRARLIAVADCWRWMSGGIYA